MDMGKFRKNTAAWIVLLSGVAALATILYIEKIATHLISDRKILAGNIQASGFNLSKGHLWLEESLSGDMTISKAEVLRLFERANQLLDEAIDNKQLSLHSGARMDLVQLRILAEKLAVMTDRRFLMAQGGAPGSEIDQLYDSTFDEFQRRLSLLMTNIDRHIQAEERYMNFSLLMIFILWACLLSITGYYLVKDTRNRAFQRKMEIIKANQRKAVSDFNILASNGMSKEALLAGAVKLVANTLDLQYSAMLKLTPDGKALFALYGAGPAGAHVGQDGIRITIGSLEFDLLFPEEPTLSNNVNLVNMPCLSALLADQRDVSVMAATVKWKDGPFGSLVAFSRQNAAFTQDDLYFIQSIAHTVSATIERNLMNIQLQGEREKLNHILQNMKDGVCIIGTDNTVTFANNALQAEFGDIVGEKCHHVFYDQSGPCPWCQNHLVFGGQTVQLEWTCQKSGKTYDLLDTPIYNQQGAVSKLEILRDITSRKKTEEALIKAKDEAEKANKAKSIFLAGMSHEIRTPLTSVIGFSRVLMGDMENPLNKHQKALLDRVISSGNQLLTLVEDILDFSKIESGHINPFVENVSTEYLATMATSSAQLLAERYEVELVIQKHNEEMWILADRRHMQQALTNLVSNSIKYNKRRGRTVISWRPLDGNTARIQVADSGQGIPEEKIARLFRPFDRLGKEGSNVEGVGIGLSIVKRLVESMGGKIGVETRIGQGSTFYIDIPLGTVKAPTVGGAQDTKSWSDDSNCLILYIDESQNSAELVRTMLHDWKGVKLVSSERVDEGITAAREMKPDIILMDMNLRGMDRLHALKTLKNQEETRSIPVLVICAGSIDPDINEVEKAGFDGFIRKPFDSGKLHNALKRFLLAA